MINLYINQRKVENITILDMKGRVRIGGNTAALYKSIRCLIQEGKRLILLNLAGVTYIDSSGLGELISSQVSILNKGGEIKLVYLTETLRELLTMTKLLEVFDVYESESEALVSFADHALKVSEPQLSLV